MDYTILDKCINPNIYQSQISNWDYIAKKWYEAALSQYNNYPIKWIIYILPK